MHLSLREARKLETRIQAKINEGVVTGRALNIHETLLDKASSTSEWLEETFALGEESIRDMLSLISARSDIRRDVQATNERVGINSLVSQRKELIGLRSVWSEAVNSYDSENGHAMTAEVLRRSAATAAESAKNSSSASSLYSRRTDTLTVSTISDTIHESADSKSRSLLRDIDAVEDKLVGLNATTKIELEGTLVQFLESQDLL